MIKLYWISWLLKNRNAYFLQTFRIKAAVGTKLCKSIASIASCNVNACEFYMIFVMKKTCVTCNCWIAAGHFPTWYCKTKLCDIFNFNERFADISQSWINYCNLLLHGWNKNKLNHIKPKVLQDQKFVKVNKTKYIDSTQ